MTNRSAKSTLLTATNLARISVIAEDLLKAANRADDPLGQAISSHAVDRFALELSISTSIQGATAQRAFGDNFLAISKRLRELLADIAMEDEA